MSKLSSLPTAVRKAAWHRLWLSTGDASKRNAAPLAIAVLDAIQLHLAEERALPVAALPAKAPAP